MYVYIVTRHLNTCVLHMQYAYFVKARIVRIHSKWAYTKSFLYYENILQVNTSVLRRPIYIILSET